MPAIVFGRRARGQSPASPTFVTACGGSDDSRHSATVLTALFEGLVRRRRADPAAVPEGLFEKTLQWLIAGIRAGGQPQWRQPHRYPHGTGAPLAGEPHRRHDPPARPAPRRGGAPTSDLREPRMSVLSALLDAVRTGAVEIVDPTTPQHATTPILRLPEPLAKRTLAVLER
jgi:hypothetical protein